MTFFRPLSITLLTLALASPAAAQLSEDLDDPGARAAPAVHTERSVVDLSIDPGRVEAMEAVLSDNASGEEVGGWITGLTSFGAAAWFLGASIWLAVDVEAFGGVGGPSPILISGLTVAPLLATFGVMSIAITGSDGDRYRRWQEAREGGLTPLELARFEGELRSDAASARVGRDASFALSLGVIASGLVAVVLGAALDDLGDDTRAFTIGGGAGIAALGGLMTGLSFLESGPERTWREYQSGGEQTSAGFRMQPVIGPGGVGFVGQF